MEVRLRVRSLAGSLERALLGAAMNVALTIVERRISRSGRRNASPAPGRRAEEGEKSAT